MEICFAKKRILDSDNFSLSKPSIASAICGGSSEVSFVLMQCCNLQQHVDYQPDPFLCSLDARWSFTRLIYILLVVCFVSKFFLRLAALKEK